MLSTSNLWITLPSIGSVRGLKTSGWQNVNFGRKIGFGSRYLSWWTGSQILRLFLTLTQLLSPKNDWLVHRLYRIFTSRSSSLLVLQGPILRSTISQQRECIGTPIGCWPCPCWHGLPSKRLATSKETFGMGLSSPLRGLFILMRLVDMFEYFIGTGMMSLAFSSYSRRGKSWSTGSSLTPDMWYSYWETLPSSLFFFFNIRTVCGC